MADIHVTGTGYPTTLDTATTLSNDTVAGDGTGSAINAAHQNGPAGAIIAIETALGTTPQGTATDVKTRLATGLSGTGQLLLGTASACAAALLASKGGTGIDTSASTGVASVSSGTWSILAKLTAALGGTNIDTSASTGVPQVASGTWTVPAQVAAAKGGTGIDSSASTGVASVSAGTWSILAKLTAALGGTNIDTSASTGVPTISSGTWSVSATLPNTKGGTGQDSSGSTGIPHVAAGAWTFGSVVNADIGSGAVHQAQISTSTGVVSSGVAAAIDFTFNDYSFFPSITNNGSNPTLVAKNAVDPGDTIGKITALAGGAGTQTTARWRYINSSFNPSIWVLYDPVTGIIQAVWESEDPLPDGSCPIASGGLPNLNVVLQSDLDGLNPMPSYTDNSGQYTPDTYLSNKVYISHPSIQQDATRVTQIKRWVALRGLAQSLTQSTPTLICSRYKIVNNLLVLK